MANCGVPEGSFGFWNSLDSANCQGQPGRSTDNEQLKDGQIHIAMMPGSIPQAMKVPILPFSSQLAQCHAVRMPGSCYPMGPSQFPPPHCSQPEVVQSHPRNQYVSEQQLSILLQNQLQLVSEPTVPEYLTISAPYVVAGTDGLCQFCAGFKDPSLFVKKHVLQDEFGIVRCPFLRKTTCQICKATGDNAHITRCCPLRKKKENGGSKNPGLTKIDKKGSKICTYTYFSRMRAM